MQKEELFLVLAQISEVQESTQQSKWTMIYLTKTQSIALHSFSEREVEQPSTGNEITPNQNCLARQLNLK